MVGRVVLILSMAVVLLFAGQPASAAEITAQLDRNPVRADESVELRVVVTGKAEGQPDFSGLEQDFEILSRSSSTSMQVINGTTSHSVIYQLDLMPKRHGRLQIPAFTLGPDSSKSLELVVQEAKTASGQAQPATDLFLEVSVDSEAPYVNSQVVYTVRLYLAVALSSASLSEPEAGTTIIEKLGDDHEFTNSRNGIQYRVVERRYVLFPDKPGSLTIEPVIMQGQVGRRSTSLFDRFNRQGPTRRLRSQAVTLEVQPRPEDYQGLWLPGRSVEMAATWSSAPDALRAGEPVTLTLTVNGVGLKAGQLPDPTLDLPAGVKSYPDQSKLENLLTADGLVGTLTRKVALIFSEPGEYILPAVTIPWWNIVTESMERAEIPAQKVRVDTGTIEPAPDRTVEAKPAAGLTEETLTEPAQKLAVYKDIWFQVSLALTCGWLITLLLWWRTAVRSGRKPAAQLDAEATGSNGEVRQLTRELREACGKNDPAAARRVLLTLQGLTGTQLHGQGPDTSDAGARLAAELDQLNSYLYAGQEQQTVWDGSRLWDAWQDNVASQNKVVENKTPLRQLYPSDKGS